MGLLYAKPRESITTPQVALAIYIVEDPVSLKYCSRNLCIHKFGLGTRKEPSESLIELLTFWRLSSAK